MSVHSLALSDIDVPPLFYSLDYRRQSCRVIQEALLHNAVPLALLDGNEGNTSSGKAMVTDSRLFQHLTQCPVAIQLFLNCMTAYGCLVPMALAEAAVDELEWSSTDPPRARDVASNKTRSDDETRSILKQLKAPPTGYRFSLRQQQEQRTFFKHYGEHLPVDHDLDLFDMDIIALCKRIDRASPGNFAHPSYIVPDKCPVLLRRMVKSLFITHAECKLNSTGHLVDHPPIYDHVPARWLTDLTSSLNE